MSNSVIFLVESYFNGMTNADQAYVVLEEAIKYAQGLIKTANSVYNLRPFKMADEKQEFVQLWSNDGGDSVLIRKINLQN